MAISYTVHHIPDPKGGKKGFVSASVRSPGTYNTDNICTLICSRSTLSPADVKAALDSLAWVFKIALSDGYHVNLEGLGHFSPSIRTIKKEEKSFNIQVDGVNFLCDRNLLRELGKAPLKRDYHQEKEWKRVDEKDWTEDVRQLTRQFGYLSPRLYCSLVCCSRYRATKDLQKYVEEGVLVRQGNGRNTLYVLAENQP